MRKALENLKVSTPVGDVEMRAADHQLVRPAVVVQAVKVAPGRGEVVVRSVEPAQRITPPANAECKMAS